MRLIFCIYDKQYWITKEERTHAMRLQEFQDQTQEVGHG